MCELQEANGLNLGVSLKSRYSATEIIDSISAQMKAQLTKAIVSKCRFISITVDESTSVSNISTVMIYVRATWPTEDSSECFAFPLELLALDSLDAEHVMTKIVDCLERHGFNKNYLAKYFVGVCTDGASTMVGKVSGVMTRLSAKFHNIVTWYCMAHRVDALKSVGQVTSSSHFWTNCIPFIEHLNANENLRNMLVY